MFAAGHHTVMGGAEDPKDGKGVAAAVFGAVIIYGVCSSKPANTAARKRANQGQVFLLFCGSQAFLHQRQRAGGEIALR